MCPCVPHHSNVDSRGLTRPMNWALFCLLWCLMWCDQSQEHFLGLQFSISGDFQDLSWLKLWTTWSDLWSDPVLSKDLALMPSWGPFQPEFSYHPVTIEEQSRLNPLVVGIFCCPTFRCAQLLVRVGQAADHFIWIWEFFMYLALLANVLRKCPIQNHFDFTAVQNIVEEKQSNDTLSCFIAILGRFLEACKKREDSFSLWLTLRSEEILSYVYFQHESLWFWTSVALILLLIQMLCSGWIIRLKSLIWKGYYGKQEPTTNTK